MESKYKMEDIVGQCIACYRPVFRGRSHEHFSGDIMHKECYEKLDQGESKMKLKCTNNNIERIKYEL